MESPREQVGGLAHTATDAAQQAMARQKDSVASSLVSFAGASRNAARQSGNDGQQNVLRIAEWAADGLDRASYALRSEDLRSLLHSAEVFARRQPVAFFLAATAAGVLATRFIKAGAGASEAAATDGQPGEFVMSHGEGLDSMDSDAESSDFPPMNPL
jgi:hypothetical protein